MRDLFEKYSCIDKCVGCGHVFGEHKDGALCGVYARPRVKWSKLGGCESATHVKRAPKEETHVRVGQQKQKKEGK